MIYLDHAATSWPKPPEVIEAMTAFLGSSGGNPGRSGHRLSVAAGRIVYETREALARFFNAPNVMNVVFTQNATHAINLALTGILDSGDTVVTTGIEHNSVMRPLRALERQGITVKIAPCSTCGNIDVSSYKQLLSDGARMVVLNHASNAIGQITPVAELAAIARQAGAIVLVDAAQTAGVIPIDVQAMNIDLLAFTGHKGLQGPPGIGGLVINFDGIDQFRPLICGGTGSKSQSEDQPEMLPDKFEGGTPNGAGIAGLGAGLRWIDEQGLGWIADHHQRLISRLREGLRSIPRAMVYGPPPPDHSLLVSLRLEGLSVSEVGTLLDEGHDVLCRVGLHCAPAAHRTMGTYPEGTVRFAVGPMTTDEDMERAVAAVTKVSGR